MKQRTVRAAAPRPLRIILLQSASSAYERGVFLGIARYAVTRANWVLHHPVGRPFIGVVPLDIAEADGIIGMLVGKSERDLLEGLKVPRVNVSARIRVPDASVFSDNVAIGRMAGQALAAQGFRHFAFYGQPGYPFSQHRGDGFAAAARETGGSIERFDNVFGPGQDERLAAWLSKLPRPLGVMGSNDGRAIEVIHACRSLGLRVPDDVAVIGVDNDELFCLSSSPPLSSIDPNCTQIGYEAAALLDRMLQGGPAPKTPMLVPPVRLITRLSSDVTAIEDADVARAVRFIRAQFATGIDVEDVCADVAVGRRVLERRFLKSVGHGPGQEIRMARLQRAREMLVETDLPVWRVSEACGYSYPQHLAVAMREQMGMTPAEFRRQYRTTQ